MMSLKLKYIEKLAVDNSPFILTAIGVVGTIGTAVLTHRSTVKAERVLLEIEDQQLQGRVPYTPVVGREKLERVWKLYIPPVVSGTMTVGAIVLANRVGTKRAAAMAAAYTIAERASSEYRSKVIEQIGATEERKIRDNIVRERVLNDPPNEGNVIVIGSGEVLCMEMYTGRYFNSSVEEIKKARNDVNYQINTDGYASVSDFYDRIGLPHTSVSDSVGWSGDKLMDIDFTTVLSEDGRPCVAINFMTGPTPQRFR